MELKQLQAEVDQFVREKGFYEANSPRPQTPRNLAISLNLEAAELLEHFQWQDEAADKKALAAEMADVFNYLLQMAGILDIDLEDAVLSKLAENRKRQW